MYPEEESENSILRKIEGPRVIPAIARGMYIPLFIQVSHNEGVTVFKIAAVL